MIRLKNCSIYRLINLFDSYILNRQKVLPKCKKVHNSTVRLLFSELFCEGPTIANSQTEGKVTAGAWIKIRCQAGFAVIGQELITCMANGDYSDKPTCEKIGKILLNPLVKSTG